ncbi:MoxR family ATPase [Kitasatospora sp. MBT66]|uniref:AAA family ATPase n=1 Tax=Kitasatospora sp. MBT66 TaxID=1444769 RepID=UPI0005BCBC2A|nr:MoxR family ATPase [Kitasatospora sp. MBT66]
MSWQSYYRGDGEPRDVTFAPPPPWRRFDGEEPHRAFQPPEGLTDAVNAALYLHRPLLITGNTGTGKSSVIAQVAAELKLGPVLKWHITSRSTLPEALCRYDALGHIHAVRVQETSADGLPDIAPFLQLGPLGTALLPSGNRPRALLVDEIDKSDIDLPTDLLDVLESGAFEIPELVRHARREVEVREWDSRETATVVDGRVRCTTFPFIVLTSNGERDFPAPFLRRCVRFDMPKPTADTLRRAVAAHLSLAGPDLVPAEGLITEFADRVARGDNLAIDQLLNAVRLVTDPDAPDRAQLDRLLGLLLRDLSGA